MPVIWIKTLVCRLVRFGCVDWRFGPKACVHEVAFLLMCGLVSGRLCCLN